jgi:hypothetical protein
MEAAMLVLFLCLQDPPVLTLEKTGRFHALVDELERAFGTTIPVADEVEDKEVRIAVKNAGFYEALDALCRAHGGATYFGNRDDFEIRAEPWVEYPAVHHGHFKVIVRSLARFRSRSVDGERAWVRVHLVLFGPPFQSVDFVSGADVTWSLLDARDGDGKDAKPEGEEPKQQMAIAEDQYLDGNVATQDFRLRDLDIGKGLSRLAGKATLKVADSRIVRIPIEKGKEVEVPGGKIVVGAVNEHEKSRSGSKWRIALTYQGEGDLRKKFENRANYEHGGEWRYLSLPYRGASFEVETWHIGGRPSWVELRVRQGERTIEVPFEFGKVVFE